MSDITVYQLILFLATFLPVAGTLVRVVTSVTREIILIQERQKIIMIRLTDIEEYLASCHHSSSRPFTKRSYKQDPDQSSLQ